MLLDYIKYIIQNKMPKLVRSKEEVFVCLKTMLEFYENHRTILKQEPKKASESILRSYDDYYEWLQDKI